MKQILYAIKVGNEYYHYEEMFRWYHLVPDINDAAHYILREANIQKKVLEESGCFRNTEITLVERIIE